MNHAHSRLINLSPLARGRKVNVRKRKNIALLKESHKTVKARDMGRCWVCDRRSTQVHHRHPRKMGGTNLSWPNLPANLICVCNTCHGQIEGERVWAINRGFLIPYFRVPSDWPIQTKLGHWVLLDNEGGMKAVPEGDLQTLLDGGQEL